MFTFVVIQTLDFFTYFNGMCAAFYLMACMVCGLQLCFNIFRSRTQSDPVLSSSLGAILIFMFCSTVCYTVGNFLPENIALYLTASTIDFLVFAGLAVLGHYIYSDNRPDKRIITVLAVPFMAIAVINIAFYGSCEFLLDVAMLILIAEYIFYASSIRRRESVLDYMYSNPDAHSLKWLRTVTLLLIGWWIVRTIFTHASLVKWYDSALYIYLTVLVLFSYIKVCGYGVPVRRDTREQIENTEWDRTSTEPDLSLPLQQSLKKLLEDKEIFLKGDLTIDEVAMKLGITSHYLSIMLHNDMNTSFTKLINKYRVERAKFMLETTNEKVAYIGYSCGFNSQQVFNRTFAKATGHTPSQWRNSLK